MKTCYYPAIILFILSLLPIIVPLMYGIIMSPSLPSIIISSIPLFFGILSMFLCKKGYYKLAWISPLGLLIPYIYIVNKLN